MSFQLNPLKKTILCVIIMLATSIVCFAQDVTPSGAFTYRYPIAIPPGTNGMAPQLAISYNSQAGNGMLGMGFQLEGLSAITRDRSYPVTFDDTTDHFLLDGQKLIKGADGYYHTEREGFLRIQAVVASNVITHWIVTLKNGTKMYYGWTADGEHKSTNDGYIAAVDKNGKAMVWALSRVEDVHANYYSVEYHEENSKVAAYNTYNEYGDEYTVYTPYCDYYPVRVIYTKNNYSSTSLKNNVIEFSYESRSDHCLVFIPNGYDMDWRLKWITVKTDGLLQRKYEIKYENSISTNRSRIISLCEYGNEGNKPIVPFDSAFISTGNIVKTQNISWSDDTIGYKEIISTGDFGECGVSFRQYAGVNFTVFPIDFDGDGVSDLVFTRIANNQLYSFRSNGDGTFTYCWGTNSFNQYFNCDWRILTGDYNGDGKIDFLCKKNYNSDFIILKSNGDGTFQQYPESGVYSLNVRPYSEMHVLDYNGDGRSDLFFDFAGTSYDSYSDTDVQFHDCKAFLATANGTYVNTFSLSVATGPAFKVVDYNGDGKSDVAIGTGVYSANQEGLFEAKAASTGGDTSLDFNGDMITDTLSIMNDYDGCTYYNYGVICLASETGKAKQVGTDKLNGDMHFPVDFNGDGMMDIIAACADYNTLFLYRSSGNGSVLTWSTSSLTSTRKSEYSQDPWEMHFGDFNGDGRQDFIRFNRYSGSVNIILYQDADENPVKCKKNDLILQIKNNDGAIINITYKPATQVEGAINPSISTYPVVANKSSRPLVTEMTMNNGFGNNITTKYEYADGRILQGLAPDRKNLGFRTFTKIDEGSETRVVTTYRQDVPYERLVDKVEVFGKVNGVEVPFQKKEYFYNISSTYASLAYKDIQMTEQREYVYDGDTANTPEIYKTTYEYDQYGNCTKVYNHGNIAHEYGTPDLSDDSYSVTEYTGNTGPNENWVFVPIKTTTYSNKLDGDLELSGEAAYFYDNESYGFLKKGLLTKVSQIKYETDPNPVETTYGYFANGNLKWVRDPKATANTSSDPTIEYFYDDYYQAYVTKVKNAMGHEAVIAYDDRMRPIKTTDANGAESFVGYDEFGRVVAQALPGDNLGDPTRKITFENMIGTQPAFTRVEEHYDLNVILQKAIGIQTQTESNAHQIALGSISGSVGQLSATQNEMAPGGYWTVGQWISRFTFPESGSWLGNANLTIGDSGLTSGNGTMGAVEQYAATGQFRDDYLKLMYELAEKKQNNSSSYESMMNRWDAAFHYLMAVAIVGDDIITEETTTYEVIGYYDGSDEYGYVTRTVLKPVVTNNIDLIRQMAKPFIDREQNFHDPFWDASYWGNIVERDITGMLLGGKSVYEQIVTSQEEKKLFQYFVFLAKSGLHPEGIWEVRKTFIRDGYTWFLNYYQYYTIYSRISDTLLADVHTKYESWKQEETNLAILNSGNNASDLAEQIVGAQGSIQYFDGLGRTLQTKSGAPGGWRTVDYYYDNSGRLFKQSVPYWTDTFAYTAADENQPHTKVEFDQIGRVTKQINTDGTFSLMMYDKRFLTSVDTAGVVSQTELNGNTITSMANGLINNQIQSYSNWAGTIDQMRGDSGVETGSPVTTTTRQAWDGTRITDQAGNVVQTINDMAGRRLSYSDPDLGTWTWTYDKNMNVATQTDTMGRIISFDYDILNRPTAEYHGPMVSRERVAQYFYDGKDAAGQPDGEDHGACKGRLTRVEYDGGWESYKYDARGRIVESRVNIDGTTKTQSFTYDSSDRVTGQTLPEGTNRQLLDSNGLPDPNGREQIAYSYASDGNILGLSSNKGGTYAGGLVFTAYGKLEDIIYGNGIATHYDYYDTATELDSGNGNRAFSFRLERMKMVLMRAEDALIADTTYHYDVRDNIVSKSFNTGDLFYSETFTYDAFSRLKTATSEGENGLYGKRQYMYDGLNNITNKEGLSYDYQARVLENGTYRHQAHAVSALKNSAGTEVASFTYDQVGNMTQETGLYKVTVQAKRVEGTYVNNPKMELWVNGQMRMRWIVENTEEYAPYTWKGYWDGTSTINVVFVNHDSSPDVADLVVDFIKVNNVTVQTESTNAVFFAGDDFETPSGGVPATETVTQTGSVCYTVTGTTPLARLFEYDYNNMVTSINENGTVSTYTYNPAGQRVKKVEDGTATYYFYANYQVEKTATTETQVVYYYINGEQIAQRTITETSEQLLYVHKDHLGSAVRLTDESGNVVQSIAYEPYGTTVYSHGNNEPDRQFTGQIKDGTGLYYYNARYYNPTLGRFITADTVLDGLNRYTYCGNNPVRYTDPTGNSYSEGKMDSKNSGGVPDSPSSPSGPDIPSPGSMTYKGITIYCEKSANSLPELPGDSSKTAKPYYVDDRGFTSDGKGRKERDTNSGPGGPCVLVDNRYFQYDAQKDSQRQIESYNFLSSKPTYNLPDKIGPNTIAAYGCLYTAVINLVNHLRYLQVKDAVYSGARGAYSRLSLDARNFEKYFTIVGNKYQGQDVIMSATTIKALIEDAVPGVKVNVTVYREELARALIVMSNRTSFSNPNISIIADVGKHPAVRDGYGQHWVGVMGLISGNLLNYVESYPDFSKYHFELSNVRTIYFIEVLK